MTAAEVHTEADRRELLTRAFAAHFGGEPSLWVRAPGRVDLMGSHTDYNQGFVMTMTLGRDTWMAARPREDGQVHLHSLNAQQGSRFDLGDLDGPAPEGWTRYVRAVAQVLAEESHPLRGFDAAVHSTLPLGSGLSSSAALELAASLVFQHLGGFRLEPLQAALLAQRAENVFVGVNCGVLDQYSSALGRAGCALLLDCRDLGSEAVPIHPSLSVVICDTRAPRQLLGSEYDERRRACEAGFAVLRSFVPGAGSLRDISPEVLAARRAHLPEVVARRCRFIIEENARVRSLARALPDGDREALRALFEASYLGARDLYEIGAPAMEAMRRAMLEAPGVVAARQAGAGFGGCLVALVEAPEVEDFVAGVTAGYRFEGLTPKVYPVSAAAGAGLL